MTVPSLIFPPSATPLSSIRIDGTTSSAMCKDPVVPLGPNFHGPVIDTPAERDLYSVS